MRAWHFYDRATGVFTGRSYATAEPVVSVRQDRADPQSPLVEVAPRDLAANTPAGCGAWRVDAEPFDWRAWQVQSGALVAYSPRPSLQKLRKEKLRALVGAARANAQAEITVQGVAFRADDEARDELHRELLIALAAQVDGQAYSLDWERADGTALSLSGAQTKGLVRAMRQRQAAIRAQLRTLRAQLSAAADAAAVAAIVWTDV